MTTIVYQRSYFGDLNGSPLDGGSLYIGVANQDPQTNPISTYWDSALTIPATQPLTITAGYVVNSGARAAVYVAADSYSLRARNSSGTQVDYVAEVKPVDLSLLSPTQLTNLFNAMQAQGLFDGFMGV